MKSRMRSALYRRLLTGCIGVAACGSLPATAGGELSRRPTTPTESYADAEVIYDSVRDNVEDSVRVIVARPRQRSGNHPVIFEAGWLNRDLVEAPSSSDDASRKVFRVLAELPGIVTVRMDFLFNVKCRVWWI
jgi:hypothetical protein